MPTFKNTFAFCFIALLFLSISAFTDRSIELEIPIKSNPSFHPVENPEITAIVDNSIQSAAPAKKQKNNQPTKTPKPTGTPPVIPPPADPGASNMMIGLALVAVVIILFGFWLNRQRVFM